MIDGYSFPKKYLISPFSLLPSVICGGNPYASGNDQQIEQRAKSLLAKMTLDEKIDYLGGYQGLRLRGIERLGIPEIVVADGPVGCRNYGKSTAYPATIGLAASWNRSLAGEFGRAIARDSRARGVHILLMPGVNIYRSPLCGRNFEYMGEDPFLISEIAVPLVKAIQKQGVMATLKHYIANNQEYDRHNISSDIQERVLREIYMPAFKNVVQEAKTDCVMTAYNLVNGIYCSEQNYLNNRVLKGQWGFNGILMSDWNSVYNAVAATNGGIDLEMPSGKYMNKNNLLPAIKSGQVNIATIDDKVLRILRSLIRRGFLDRNQKDETIPLNDPSSADVALQMAREGIVLLKNTDKTLPLNRNKIKSIAVLGPNASMKYKSHGAGGSSYTEPFQVVSVIDAIKTLAGEKFMVLTAKKENSGDTIFNFDDFDFSGSGLDCKIYDYMDNYRETEPLGVQPIAQRQDKQIDFSATENNFEMKGKPFTALWQGTFKPQKDGIYRLDAQVKGGLIYVLLDDEMVFQASEGHKQTDLFLEKDKAYHLKFYFVAYPPERNKWFLRLGCNFIAEFDDYAQVETMQQSDVVVLCVGFNPNMEFEGGDRSYKLPPLQEKLIKKAIEINPQTIVVATAGGSFATESWIDDVTTLIHNWYPGQNGATALAEILFGLTNPSGKLPITFEKRLKDSPVYNSYHDTDHDKHVKYSEGLFVGYRGYEKNKIEPLFCFGHGLSYTQFKYSYLKIIPITTSASQEIIVSAEIENVGKRSGAETVQLYISDLECSVPRPVKELKGFEKIFLEPGEKKRVQFIIDVAKLSFYCEEKKQWVAEPGEFRVLLASSLEDIRLQGVFEWLN